MTRLARMAVAGALFGLIVVLGVRLLSGQDALAQGTVVFDIDPDITGNTADTLGAVEDCLRVDGSGGFDGLADITIDVVVQGDTQAPRMYQTTVPFEAAKVQPVRADGVIKLPGALDFTSQRFESTFGGAAIYLTVGKAGIPGDGTIARIDLDIDFTTPTVTIFRFTYNGYTSLSGAHPVTADRGAVAINTSCDTDSDGDELPDALDNCPDTPNPDQADADGDMVGDICDNCPSTANADQRDTDGDGLGNYCDPDRDNDTILNADDNCNYVPNPDQADADDDDDGDACDNCPYTPNPDQDDWDGDGVGNACETAPGNVDFDIDPDVTGNTADTLGAVENCVRVDGSGGLDGLADATIDVVVQGDTRAPMVYDAWVTYEPTKVDPVSWDDLIKMPGAAPVTIKQPPQLDASAGWFSPGHSGTPGDGTLVRIDLDIDFTTPTVASFAFAVVEYASSDGEHPSTADGGLVAINMDCDGDSDGDGVSNVLDNCPGTPNADQSDTDGDSRGDACDNCPNVSNPDQADSDSDAIGDACDVCANDVNNDADNDGVCVGSGYLLPKTGDNDNCPAIPNQDQLDADGDGEGDACDNCPNVSNPDQTDSDSDAIGDACEESDGDGFPDAVEVYVGTDPADNCPDVVGADDAWPLDINNDRVITAPGDINIYSGRINAAPGSPKWWQRLDLNADGGITAPGDLNKFYGMIAHTCTN